jgi:hypothetical protein
LGAEVIRRILDAPNIPREGDVNDADETARLDELDEVAQLR